MVLPWQVCSSPRAKRELKKLSHGIQERIAAAIEGLADDPRPRDSVTIGGRHSLHRLELGIGGTEYRVLYHVDDDKLVVLVLGTGSRENFYDRLKNLKESD